MFIKEDFYNVYICDIYLLVVFFFFVSVYISTTFKM